MIIFLYGEDVFRSRAKLLELKAAYLRKHEDAGGLFDYAFDESGEEVVKEFAASLGTGGLFASKKLIVVRNLLSAPETLQGRVLEILERNIARMEKDADTVVVFWEEGVPKKTNKLFRLFEKEVAKKQQFELIQGARLEQWTLHRLQTINPQVRIQQKALTRLLAETESDLFRLDRELEKLAAFCENGVIGDAEIDTFIAASPKEAVFEALEALTQRRKSRALALFARQLKKGENALYLLSMVAWQLRNLLKVAEKYTRGVRVAPVIAKELKMHPFVVQKLLRQAGSFPLERLKKSFALLADLDLQSKTGAIDPKLALDLFVVKF
jgi:DNA polymerase-3 subunit delta